MSVAAGPAVAGFAIAILSPATGERAALCSAQNVDVKNRSPHFTSPALFFGCSLLSGFPFFLPLPLVFGPLLLFGLRLLHRSGVQLSPFTLLF
jgi:hypothetical protein